MCSSPAGSPRFRGGPSIRSPGVAVHDATIPEDLVAALRRLADELGVPLSSVLLAAHAKVLAALSGERQVTTGYVAGTGGRTVAVPADDRGRLVARSCCSTPIASRRSCCRTRTFRLDELRRELSLTGPAFETVFDPTGIDGDLGEDIVLRLGISQRGDRARCCDCGIGPMCLNADCAAQDRRLSPHGVGADGRRSGCRAPAAEPAVRRGAPLPARRAGRAAPGAAGPPGA